MRGVYPVMTCHYERLGGGRRRSSGKGRMIPGIFMSVIEYVKNSGLGSYGNSQ